MATASLPVLVCSTACFLFFLAARKAEGERSAISSNLALVAQSPDANVPDAESTRSRRLTRSARRLLSSRFLPLSQTPVVSDASCPSKPIPPFLRLPASTIIYHHVVVSLPLSSCWRAWHRARHALHHLLRVLPRCCWWSVCGVCGLLGEGVRLPLLAVAAEGGCVACGSRRRLPRGAVATGDSGEPLLGLAEFGLELLEFGLAGGYVFLPV